MCSRTWIGDCTCRTFFSSSFCDDDNDDNRRHSFSLFSFIAVFVHPYTVELGVVHPSYILLLPNMSHSSAPSSASILCGRAVSALAALNAAHTSSEDRLSADAFLRELQQRNEAWEVCCELLANAHDNMYVLHYAGMTLHLNIQREWKRLSHPLQQRVRQQLLTAIRALCRPGVQLPDFVVGSLALSLAAVALRTPDGCSSLVKMLLPMTATAPMLILCILTALADEVHHSPSLSYRLRGRAMKQIRALTPSVMGFLHGLLQQPVDANDKGAVQRLHHSLACALAWAHQSLSLAHLDEFGIVDDAIQLIKHIPVVAIEKAAELLTSAMTHCEIPVRPNHKTATAKVGALVAGLHPLFDRALAACRARSNDSTFHASVSSDSIAFDTENEDDVTEAHTVVRNICYLVVALGEQEVEYIAGGSPDALQCAQLAMKCSRLSHDTKLVELSLQFWNNLQDVPVAERHPSLRQPVFMELLKVVLGHARLPLAALRQLSPDAVDVASFRMFRSVLQEAILSSFALLGKDFIDHVMLHFEKVITLEQPSSQSGDGARRLVAEHAREIELVLFAFTCVSPQIQDWLDTQSRLQKQSHHDHDSKSNLHRSGTYSGTPYASDAAVEPLPSHVTSLLTHIGKAISRVSRVLFDCKRLNDCVSTFARGQEDGLTEAKWNNTLFATAMVYCHPYVVCAGATFIAGFASWFAHHPKLLHSMLLFLCASSVLQLPPPFIADVRGVNIDMLMGAMPFSTSAAARTDLTSLAVREVPSVSGAAFVHLCEVQRSSVAAQTVNPQQLQSLCVRCCHLLRLSDMLQGRMVAEVDAMPFLLGVKSGSQSIGRGVHGLVAKREFLHGIASLSAGIICCSDSWGAFMTNESAVDECLVVAASKSYQAAADIICEPILNAVSHMLEDCTHHASSSTLPPRKSILIVRSCVMILASFIAGVTLDDPASSRWRNSKSVSANKRSLAMLVGENSAHLPFEHPAIPVVQRIVPMLCRIAQVFPSSFPVVDAVCELADSIFTTLKKQMKPVLLPIVKSIVGMLQKSQYPFCVHVLQLPVILFGVDDGATESVTIFASRACLHTCLSMLHVEPNQLGTSALLPSTKLPRIEAFPELVASVLQLARVAALRSPYSLFRSHRIASEKTNEVASTVSPVVTASADSDNNLLVQLTQFALVVLLPGRCSSKETLNAALELVKETLTIRAPKESSGIPPEITTSLRETLASQLVPAVMRCVLYGLAGTLPESIHRSAGDLMYTTLLTFPQPAHNTVVQYLQSGDFPAQELGVPDRKRIANAFWLLKDAPKRKFRLLVDDFVTVCESRATDLSGLACLDLVS
jgi:Importin-beta N-terminal domain